MDSKIDSGMVLAGTVMDGLSFIGVDFICVALTLAYIARLVFYGVGVQNAIAASCCVAKVSLRGQQIARRAR
jgi:hypothetical protein